MASAPQQPQAPYGAGYQGYQPYPGPGAPSGTQQAPEAKKGGKGKLIGIIAAAVVVVLVAAGAAWFVWFRGDDNDNQASEKSATATATDDADQDAEEDDDEGEAVEGGDDGQELANGASYDFGWVDDFKDQPNLGDPIVGEDLLVGDFYSVRFGAFIDANHVLVIGEPDTSSVSVTGTSWYEGYDEDYERGYADGLAFHEANPEFKDCTDLDCPAGVAVDDYYQGTSWYDGLDDGYDDGWNDAFYQRGYGYLKLEVADPTLTASAIGLLNVDKTKLDWQIDLGGVTGFDLPKVSWYLYSEAGVLAVEVEDVATPGMCATMAVDMQGELTGFREYDELLGVSGDYFLVRTYEGLSGVEAIDFENDLWTEVAHRSGIPSSLLSVNDGTAYALTDGGWVDLVSGDPIGWGNANDEGVDYTSVGGGVVLRFEDDGGSGYSAMRVDPETGDNMWDDPVAGTEGQYVVLAEGNLVFERESQVLAVDANSGEEQWSTAIEDIALIAVLPGGEVEVISTADYEEMTFTLLDPNTGEVLTTLKNASASFIALGYEVVYGTDSNNALAAYDLYGDPDQPLWTLDLELGAGDSVWLMGSDGRLWAAITTSQDGDGGSTVTLRELLH
ncbi:MAG: PQQ-binding-like beta-propeller repeat protein [Bifidobacteriaceae bacterium]|jgi:hypothetical protein|nr:PQQ-binding-like beta-propeller repeat protein [Bifidobacteriaceae bacterium]